jgi:hypothetical protein
MLYLSRAFLRIMFEVCDGYRGRVPLQQHFALIKVMTGGDSQSNAASAQYWFISLQAKQFAGLTLVPSRLLKDARLVVSSGGPFNFSSLLRFRPFSE